MKWILLGTLFAAAPFNAFVDAPGGAGYGWGNMLLKGQRGVAIHVIAATTNDTSDNSTFGMITGTNGCHTNGAPSYGGKPLLVLGSVIDKLPEDMAKGSGEALTTYAVVLGMQLQDREYFTAVTHEHLSETLSKSDTTAADVYADTQAILKQDVHLAKYAEQT